MFVYSVVCVGDVCDARCDGDVCKMYCEGVMGCV